jgi:hypothetical protein
LATWNCSESITSYDWTMSIILILSSLSIQSYITRRYFNFYYTFIPSKNFIFFWPWRKSKCSSIVVKILFTLKLRSSSISLNLNMISSSCLCCS